jgi:hypothetical protein
MIVIAAFILSSLLLGLGGMISDEARGWLERIPYGLLRIAAMRLPACQREAIYCGEWLPELIFIMRKADGRPVTRLVIGARYATSMIRSARRVARSLAPVRDQGLPTARDRGGLTFPSIVSTRARLGRDTASALLADGWKVTPGGVQGIEHGRGFYVLTHPGRHGEAIVVPARPVKWAIKRVEPVRKTDRRHRRD